MRRYTREDVKTHYGSDRPAVNVKVHAYPFYAGVDFEEIAAECDAPGFSEEWIEQHLTDEASSYWFWEACELGYEQLRNDVDAEEVFGDWRIEIEADGRMGGWAVVRGLPPIEEWDAILLARWRKFERFCRETVADVPYQTASLIALNAWRAWHTAYVASFGDVEVVTSA